MDPPLKGLMALIVQLLAFPKVVFSSKSQSRGGFFVLTEAQTRSCRGYWPIQAIKGLVCCAPPAGHREENMAPRLVVNGTVSAGELT